MKRTATILITSVLLTSCTGESPESSIESSNPDIPVDLLFVADSCTVYRFYDVGTYHYFVKCPSNSATISTEARGKLRAPVSVPTSYLPD